LGGSISVDISSFLSTYVFDWGFALCAGVAVLAAVVRAFTGFGANVVWGPVLMLYYGPVEMVAIMAIAAVATSFQVALPSARQADWRTIGIMFAAMLVATPFGVITLLHVDPHIFKRAFAVFILVCALILASGWVYRGTHSKWATAATGALSGWIAGFAGVGGPILVIYFLAAPGDLRQKHANNSISVTLLAPITLAMLLWEGAVDADAWLRGLMFLAPVFLGQWIGLRLFRVAPIELFRKVSLILMAIIGVTVLLS
jgi:uncharacterized membrane protein YfcA